MNNKIYNDPTYKPIDRLAARVLGRGWEETREIPGQEQRPKERTADTGKKRCWCHPDKGTLVILKLAAERKGAITAAELTSITQMSEADALATLHLLERGAYFWTFSHMPGVFILDPFSAAWLKL